MSSASREYTSQATGMYFIQKRKKATEIKFDFYNRIYTF